ncbi:HU family DNA-binding protein [Embleya sp. MST-111070]|uniref:HU family DNA-binding protein n=1 Tax=Embleya sp. MST-111070 TaxID=3398231 RepID=UPI003F731FAC
MNKAQLVEAIADKLGGRAAAEEAVDAVLDTIIRSVVAGDRVSVTGFGSFEKVDRAARYARNPQTGERVRVKKTSVPRFRPGQGFKDLTGGTKKLTKGETAIKKASPGTVSGGTTVAGKKAAAKKTTAKKATAKKTAKKATTRAAAPAAARKTTAKKATTRATAAAKTTAAKKTTAKKVTAKKTTAKKTTAKATPAKTTAKKAAKPPTRGASGRKGTAAKRATGARTANRA